MLEQSIEAKLTSESQEISILGPTFFSHTFKIWNKTYIGIYVYRLINFHSPFLHCFVTGQCNSYNVASSSTSSTQITVSWECNDGGSLDISKHEYQVTYRLHNRDQCGTSTGSNHVQRTAFTRLKPDSGVQFGVFQYTLILSKLFPHSTYELNVISRTFGTHYLQDNIPPPIYQETGETGKVDFNTAYMLNRVIH